MMIQMQSTDLIVDVDGVECRIWNAITEKGTQCFVYAHRIAIPNDGTANTDDIEELKELFESRIPITIRVKNEDADS